MKTGHLGLIIVAGVALVLWFQYRSSGAAANCGFLDTLLGKCGTS